MNWSDLEEGDVLLNTNSLDTFLVLSKEKQLVSLPARLRFLYLNTNQQFLKSASRSAIPVVYQVLKAMEGET